MAVGRAAAQVEDRAAGHVVVHDAVDQAVEPVALPHELAADRVDLGRRHPVGRRLLVNANELGREHQRREVHDRHVGRDAVVVGRIALRDGQRFAAALRRADVVVEARALAVHALDQHHRGVVRLLHLRVAEVADRFVVERPVLIGRRGRRPAAAAERRQLVARVAAVGGEAALQQRRSTGAELAAGEVRNDAVDAAAAHLRRPAVPRRRQDHAEVDRRAPSARCRPARTRRRRGSAPARCRSPRPTRPASVTLRTGSPMSVGAIVATSDGRRAVGLGDDAILTSGGRRGLRCAGGRKPKRRYEADQESCSFHLRPRWLTR